MTRLPNQPFAKPQGAITFAHRGGSNLWPENTLLSFHQAMQLGADALEMDIHLTSDNELMVIHDDTVERTTNGIGAVRDQTRAALQQLDAGYWWSNDNGRSYPFRGQGLTIPTLREVFEAFPNSWINVDIKQHDAATVDAFVALIEAYNMEAKVLAGSFDTQAVARFRTALPQVATAATRAEIIRLWLLSRVGLGRWARIRADAVQVSEWYGRFHIITPRFIRAAHQNKTAVHVWTVDDEVTMKRLLAMGVDGIMSDQPDRLLALLKA